MSERIEKLQPDRTIALRGFSDLGAAAAVHSASPTGFTVSGVFRDPADFAVLMLYDADNFYEHPSIRYLPDMNFDGLTLSFDVHYTGLFPLDSPKYPTIDWPYLDVIAGDGTPSRIPLFAHAVQSGGTYTAASAQFTVEDNGLKEFDRLTLWYLNYAFDYIVPKVECNYLCAARGAGVVHSVTVKGVPYSYLEKAGDSDAQVAAGLAAALATCPLVAATRGDGTMENGPGNQVNLRNRLDDGSPYDVGSTEGTAAYTMYGIGASTVAAALAAQINAVNWSGQGVANGLAAAVNGAVLAIATTRPGTDGNMIAMYAVARNDRLRTTPADVNFTGGSSGAAWRVTLDFSALNIPNIRQMWLTFAPALANGAPYESTEWEAVFSNWTLSGPEDVKALPVAGPGSVRVEDTDPLCVYTGAWTIETGFYSGGEAKQTSTPGDSVTASYYCGSTHDVWIGTSLYSDRGAAGVSVDGDAETDLVCALAADSAVNTRRRVRTGVPAGYHQVTLRLKTGSSFYFDYVDAVVASGVPDPAHTLATVSPALDYSTDHTYKLPPERLLWIFDKLGYAGPINQYLGVFWYNQRVRVNAVIPSATVTFAGQYQPGDQIFLNLSGQSIGKSVLQAESSETIAKHFAYFINATLVGVWASAKDNVLTITNRSPAAAYAYGLGVSQTTGPESTGVATAAGSLSGGQPGNWQVDPAQSPALNLGARKWLAAMYRGCAARGLEITTAGSMELVLPPPGYAAQFADGTPVQTTVGFANLNSTHCAFNARMLAYQKSVFQSVADLMNSAGLVPHIQFGEYCWWYFAGNGGMAYFDADTAAAAQEALGRPLYAFAGPDDDPSVNGGADAAFLRDRLRDHVRSLGDHLRGLYPNAVLEVLFPYDVNYPTPAGIHNLGGRLNHFVNFPLEWQSRATAGFDRLKVEALDFGAWNRNLDLALTAPRFALSLSGWAPADIRHLIPVFAAGYPWEKEVQRSLALGIPAVNLWAFDHICIFNLDPQPGRPLTTVQRVGGAS
jgi:hypothetical protein